MKLATLGALGVAGGGGVCYLLLVWAFSPTATGGAPGARGGIDHVLWLVLAVAMIVPVAVSAWAHLAFAKQLREGPQPI